MSKKAGNTAFSSATLLAFTALSMLFAAHGAYAQDAAANAPEARFTAVFTTKEQPAQATNFDARWGSDEKEFVLGADGVVKGAADAIAFTSPEDASKSIHNKIGSFIAPSSKKMNALLDVTTKGKPTGSLSQFGTFSKDEAVADNAAPCGASPLTPDEIKVLVADAARRHGVDEAFAIAITWAESQFDQSRNSSKGARGPMQLIPATADRFGVEDICDPAQNIEGGVKYLRFLLDEFQNPLLVAAAYNSGEQRIYEYGGVPPFQETVGYVAKVVNFQLGLPMPSAAKKKMATLVRQGATTPEPSNNAGVIAVEKSGGFVGGVMHF